MNNIDKIKTIKPVQKQGEKIRNKTIDLIRGIGILLMVYGHAAKYTSFVVLFHMAIFFITSGYCYNRNNTKTLSSIFQYIKRKFITLWKPFVLFNGIFILMHNFFIRINIYTDNPLFLQECGNSITKLYKPLTGKDIARELIKNLLFQGDTQVGGALWFLQALFFVTIMYGIADYLIGKLLFKIFKNEDGLIYVQLFVAVIFLIVGWHCSLYGIVAKHLDRAFSCYWLTWFGIFIKKKDFMDKLYNFVRPFIVFILMLLILVVARTMGSISLNGNMYGNPVFLIVCSVSGWLMIYSLAYMIEKLSEQGKWYNIFIWINSSIRYLSVHSVPVIGLHFLSFKIINYLCIKIKKMPEYMMAAFPTVMTEGVWFLAYMLVGLVVPLAADMAYKIILSKVKKHVGIISSPARR